MKKPFYKICQFSMALAAVMWASGAYCSGASNTRSASVENGARVSRATTRVVNRGSDSKSRGVLSSAARTSTQQKKVVSGRGSVKTPATNSERSTVRQSVVGMSNRSMFTAPRSAMTAISRAAVRPFGGATNARSAKKISNTGLARAASTARATAVFNDISKIGGGYAACRESYATCMDQFCANANDTYRRCYCSEKFTNFRDTENALDQAKTLLQQFEDNNLNAVDKSAAEVNAMYSATAGEAAIKTDVSGAQALLNSIGDLLSGKKTTLDVPKKNTSGSLGVMDLDFSSSMDDIWGGGGETLFNNNSSAAVDMTALEGQALFNTSNKQCVAIISDACENQAMLNMATSAYGIMIAQDCNMYEKNVDKKREQVKQAVRQAEKVLRDARLEEYRAHNSADVNECLTKVQNAIKTDVACGPNYERCLDYSGAYVNQSTGEPIYSARLFEMENLITLAGVDGGGDILSQNPNFDKFLDERKMFANSALDSCRDIADTVWTEFKRSALIEISQAQDEKLEEVRMSCVSTMADCYDTQTGALKAFDTTESQSTGAIAAYAAKSMCKEKVVACAMLYSPNGQGCEFDENGHIKNGGTCGLTALLSFVDSVDNVRVAEGCQDAVQKYVNDLCTPTSGEEGHPWNCRMSTFATSDSTVSESAPNNTFEGLVQSRAVELCNDPTNPSKTYLGMPTETKRMINKIISDTKSQLFDVLEQKCTELEGYWYTTSYQEDEERNNSFKNQNLTPLTAFYSNVYGRTPDVSQVGQGLGTCIENTKMVRCLDYNSGEAEPVATYDAAKDECIFTDVWYQNQCEMVLNGFYENGICYTAED